MEPEKRERLFSFYFLLFLLAVLLIRLFVYFQYSIRFIDTDQPYMWMGASDFAQGRFLEPRYYGQNYNTFMEGLFAVPLVWLDVPVYYAVPAATHFISLFPFCFTAVYLFYSGLRQQALFVLGVLLCLPIHYDLLNSLPRGFVTGLFFCSFFIVSLLHPRRYGALALNTLLAVTGYFVNPNSVLVSIPCLTYLFLQNYRRPGVYFIGAAALLFAWLNYRFFDQLYFSHPEYIQNPLTTQFSTVFFPENISNVDRRFCHINFFESGKSWTILLTIGIMLLLLFRQNRMAFLAFLTLPCIVLFSFCVSKIAEGSLWVFMSYSRMFLGIPLLISLFATFLKVRLPFVTIVPVLPLLFFGYKVVTHEAALVEHFNKDNFLGVEVHRLTTALDGIRNYKNVCREHSTDFMLISNGFWLNNVLAYGGPAVDKEYPQTLESRLEKRHWIREKFQDSVVPKMIFISVKWELDSLIPRTGWFRIKDLNGYGLYLIDQNTLPTKKLIRVLETYER